MINENTATTVTATVIVDEQSERMESWDEWAAFGLPDDVDCNEQFTTEVDPILGDYESLWGE